MTSRPGTDREMIAAQRDVLLGYLGADTVVEAIGERTGCPEDMIEPDPDLAAEFADLLGGAPSDDQPADVRDAVVVAPKRYLMREFDLTVVDHVVREPASGRCDVVLAGGGRTAGLSTPDIAGQVRAVRQARSVAGIDPATPAATRFEALGAAKAGETEARRPVRRAGVNTFGFGGIDAHVYLEQAATRPALEVAEPERVLRLSAPTVAEMGCLLDHDDVLSESDTGRGRVRLALVDPTPRRLNLARKVVAKGRPWRGRNDLWFVPEPLLGAGGGKLAFVFPGPENESEACADDIARPFGIRRETPDVTIGDVGRHGTGVFQLGRLLDTALRTLRVTPDALAGHSLGEWTAMAVAGIHDGTEVEAFLAGFDPDAFKVPGLAFAVIGAAASVVTEVLKGQSEVVLSHDNAPNQAMICGPAEAVDDFVRGFRADGVISQVLPSRSGFHTPMLAPYLGPISEAAERHTPRPAKLPVWSATTGKPYPAAAAEVRDLFVRHLLEPVRFRGLVENLYAAGFRAFVQTGAGRLGALIGNTLHDREHLVVAAHSAHRPGLGQLPRTAMALWADGADPAFELLPGQRGTKRERQGGRHAADHLD